MFKGLGKDAAIAELFAIGFAAMRPGNRTGASNALQQMAAMMEDAPVKARRSQHRRRSRRARASQSRQGPAR